MSVQKRGYNGCINSAVEALRFLSDHDRPIGGEQTFNSEHLLQIANELDKSMNQAYNNGLDTAARLVQEAISDTDDMDVILCGLEASKKINKDVQQ